jgi:hypothetical protein
MAEFGLGAAACQEYPAWRAEVLVTCAAPVHISWNNNVRPVQDLHKEAARNQQANPALPRINHS